MYKINHLLRSIISNFLLEYVVFLMKYVIFPLSVPQFPWCSGPRHPHCIVIHYWLSIFALPPETHHDEQNQKLHGELYDSPESHVPGESHVWAQEGTKNNVFH